MKRLYAISNLILVILFAFSFMTPATADEGADRDKCIAKGEDAVKLIKEVGQEAAFKKIQNTMDDDMRFHWENGHVFVIEDEKAMFLANPAFPVVVGREYLNEKDADGKLYCQEIIRIAKIKGKGWITCNKSYGKRDCYVLKVPDGNLIVVSVLKLGPLFGFK
jgi:cytochrome c